MSLLNKCRYTRPSDISIILSFEFATATTAINADLDRLVAASSSHYIFVNSSKSCLVVYIKQSRSLSLSGCNLYCT